MLKIYSKKIKINSYEADKNNNTKLNSIFQWFSEAAWEHAKDLEVGFEELENENNFWVLLGVKLSINRLPKWQDNIIIDTWPNGIEGFYFNREFIIWNENKTEQLAVANSKWFIYNRVLNHPIIPQPQSKQFDQHTSQWTPRTIEWNKLKPTTQITTNQIITDTIERTSYFTDIDMHQHTNNATYIKWIEDYIKGAIKIKEISIHYLKEVAEDEKVMLKFSKIADILYCNAFINDVPYFRVVINHF